ncbi:NAD-dependent epimerase/dehydratase family protein [Sphingomonas alpina]|uniref:Epimerase n=1 Tax=Sphingomonas alpina TaxID=653931 RepID=A0A7H0LFI3_9SPHN|nr:NAD-dependent epimerase/dehydratase family protein [Sphingomonas alpina]QNQ08436.1 epimerase [Sphingomonas alpina]
MKVLIFGATGMVGQGVLRECLRDDGVTEVMTVGRAITGVSHGKLRELVVEDMFAIGTVREGLLQCDACFFCLGVSAVGMSEADYTRITHDLTLVVAERIAALNPGSTFVYVTGAGTSEQSRMMWARVKGRTEAALARLPFKANFMFRPGFIQPLHGIVSKTGWYRAAYAVTGWIAGPIRRQWPGAMTTTETVGRAMIAVAKRGFDKPVLDNADINRAAS